MIERMVPTLAGLVLEDGDLSGTEVFSRANLQFSKLKNVDFSRANLTRTNFEDSTLTDVDFRGATLSRSTFARAELNNVWFDWASLQAVHPRPRRSHKVL